MTKFNQWSLKCGGNKKTNQKTHKQFFLDRAARYKSGMAKTSKDENIPVTDVTWWFHNFTVKVEGKDGKLLDTIKSFSDRDVKYKIKDKLFELPIAAASTDSKFTQARNYSIGIDPANSTQLVAEDKNRKLISGSVDIRSLTLKNMLIEFAKHNLLPEAKDLLPELGDLVGE